MLGNYHLGSRGFFGSFHKAECFGFNLDLGSSV